VWGTPTLAEVDSLYANATSSPIPAVLCSTIGIVKTNDDCELLHPLMKKVVALGEQFEQ
jgi:hypothetical protein